MLSPVGVQINDEGESLAQFLAQTDTQRVSDETGEEAAAAIDGTAIGESDELHNVEKEEEDAATSHKDTLCAKGQPLETEE